MILSAITLAVLIGNVQESPVAIPKAELPKTANCAVCEANGADHEGEKPVAGIRYKGVSYFFCAAKEVDEFKKDPEAFVAPVFPRPAPAFRATGLDGSYSSLDSFKGKVVLVDFWATWCKPCVKSMPALDALYKKQSEKGLEVVGISIDEDAKKVPAFLKKKPMAYTIVIDDAKEPTWAAYKVRAVPALFLIDRKGQIVAQWRGEPKMKEVEAAVAAELAKDR
jgi:peroxiredoxin